MVHESKTCACGESVSREELFHRLDQVIAEYKTKAGGLIPVLQIAQGIFGHLPEDVVRHISRGLNKPVSEVTGVVSFYSFFSTQPRGRHVIRVCMGTACYVRGGKQVLDAIRKELGVEVGGTTADREFTLDIARCFGACGLAPAIAIDEQVYQRVKPSRVGEILTAARDGAAVPSAPAQKGSAS